MSLVKFRLFITFIGGCGIDIFFDLRRNKRLRKQPRRWCSETPSHSHYAHYDVTVVSPLGQPIPYHRHQAHTTNDKNVLNLIPFHRSAGNIENDS